MTASQPAVACYTTRITDALILISTMSAWRWEPGEPPVPSLARLFELAALAWRHGGDEDQVIALMVHDTADNFDYASVPLRVHAQFGPRAAGMVTALLGRPAPDADGWREAAERYVEQVGAAEADVALVIACRELHELAVGAPPATAEARWYRGAMRDALAPQLPARLLAALGAALP